MYPPFAIVPTPLCRAYRRWEWSECRWASRARGSVGWRCTSSSRLRRLGRRAAGAAHWTPVLGARGSSRRRPRSRTCRTSSERWTASHRTRHTSRARPGWRASTPPSTLHRRTAPPFVRHIIAKKLKTSCKDDCVWITQLKQQIWKRRYYLAAHRRLVNVRACDDAGIKR